MRCALSASQCASSPSPSEVAMPIPVIQASTAGEFDGFGSVMRHDLLWKADTLGHRVHVSAQVLVRKWNVAERKRGVAPRLAADADLGFGDGIAGALVHHAGVDFQ